MSLRQIHSTEGRISLVKEVAKQFAERAEAYDRDGSFPYENIEDLKLIDYPLLTVPKEYGGVGASLEEMLHMQEIIASYCGSTALSIGWHIGIVKHLSETKKWPQEKYESLIDDIVHTKALINSAATEPATGSPTRGGRPETFVKKVQDGWILTGRKSFTTLSPVLDYFIVSASIDGTETVGNFLVKKTSPGVSIDETWDSVAMKATGSHDLVLDNVYLNEDDFLEELVRQKSAQGWLLHIPAVYLGIAKAAQRYAIQFATTYSPNSIQGTISEIPKVKERIGKIAQYIFECETILYAVARQWDQAEQDTKQLLATALSTTKLVVVNKAVEIVDLAMRIVGARSLSASCPLQRYYRDVRAGLHNPPMDDMTIIALANESIEKQEKIFSH